MEQMVLGFLNCIRQIVHPDSWFWYYAAGP